MPRFVELALDFCLSAAAKNHGHFVSMHLSRALVHNFDNALFYLNGNHDETRKTSVCKFIAGGLKRHPQTIADFALNVVVELAPQHLFNILRSLVLQRVEEDYLDALLAEWLVDNFRRTGYGAMLTTLRQRPTHWQRLLDLGTLPSEVLRDFEGPTTNPPSPKPPDNSGSPFNSFRLSASRKPTD